MFKLKIVCLSLVCLLFSKGLSAQVADKILGDWISPEKDLIVRCFKSNGHYFSKVVWFKRYYDNTPDDPNGVPEKEWFNKLVMTNFKFADNEWANGEIYNLKNGKKYSAYLRLNNDKELRVVGYIFFRFFSETILFTKYTDLKLPEFK